MTQKELDRIRRIDRWKTLIAERKASEKNLTDFCKEKGVTTASYYYWNNIITKMVLDEADAIGVLKAPSSIPEAKAVVEAAQEVTETLADPDNVQESPASSSTKQRIREKREEIVEFVFQSRDDWMQGKGRRPISVDRIRYTLHTTQREACQLMNWMEEKGIVSSFYPGNPTCRKILITRDQWTAIKDELLDTDATVSELAAKLPQMPQAESSAPPTLKTAKSNSGSNTYLDKLEEIPPQSLQKKRTSAGHEAGTGHKGFVFDLRNNRLYVSGGASDEAVQATAHLLMELERQRSQQQRCTPHAQRPMPPVSKDELEAPSAGSLPS